ncbi:hypothetical protein P3S68_033655 [Capsicum galapagoense]
MFVRKTVFWNSFSGAFELVSKGKSNGLKVVVASVLIGLKLMQTLAAPGLPITITIYYSSRIFPNLP